MPDKNEAVSKRVSAKHFEDVVRETCGRKDLAVIACGKSTLGAILVSLTLCENLCKDCGTEPILLDVVQETQSALIQTFKARFGNEEFANFLEAINGRLGL